MVWLVQRHYKISQSVHLDSGAMLSLSQQFSWWRTTWLSLQDFLRCFCHCCGPKCLISQQLLWKIAMFSHFSHSNCKILMTPSLMWSILLWTFSDWGYMDMNNLLIRLILGMIIFGIWCLCEHREVESFIFLVCILVSFSSTPASIFRFLINRMVSTCS